jgi:hypothetical protein
MSAIFLGRFITDEMNNKRMNFGIAGTACTESGRGVNLCGHSLPQKHRFKTIPVPLSGSIIHPFHAFISYHGFDIINVT